MTLHRRPAPIPSPELLALHIDQAGRLRRLDGEFAEPWHWRRAAVVMVVLIVLGWALVAAAGLLVAEIVG